MDRQERMNNAAAVYDEWVAAHPDMDPDNPTPEQENDYMVRLLDSDPEIISQAWGEAVSKMSEEELLELSKSPFFQPMEFDDPVTASAPLRQDELEAVVDTETNTVVALSIIRPGNRPGFVETLHRTSDGWSSNIPSAEFSTDETIRYQNFSVTEDYIPVFDAGERSVDALNRHLGSESLLAAAPACPAPTQDLELNLENRQNAIDNVGYGPLNPKRPNDDFWQAKADRWNTTKDEAKSSRCGNCAAFIVTPTMRECINQGLGNDADSWDVVEAGDLGYCEALDFKCAAERTCDAWIVGGPVTEEK